MSTVHVLADPASHGYLGNNMEDVKRRNVLLVNETYELLLLPIRDIILFPGETLPLRIQNPVFISEIQKLCESNVNVYGDAHDEVCHLGVVNAAWLTRSVFPQGTTIEVRSKSRRSGAAVANRSESDEELVLTSKGRHRFKILKLRRQRGVTFATVRIQSEAVPRCTQYLSLPHAVKAAPTWALRCCSPEHLARLAYDLLSASLVWEQVR